MPSTAVTESPARLVNGLATPSSPIRAGTPSPARSRGWPASTRRQELHGIELFHRDDALERERRGDHIARGGHLLAADRAEAVGLGLLAPRQLAGGQQLLLAELRIDLAVQLLENGRRLLRVLEGIREPAHRGLGEVAHEVGP